MKTVLALFLLSLCLSARAQAEDPIDFGSENLQAAVEGELGISDPTATDMLKLTFLDANSRTITDLTGLEYAVNLQSLNLMHIHNSDFSILSGLPDLEVLNLAWNEISDISFVSGLGNLASLDLHHNDISDISSLSGLSQLSTLNLDENRIRDISVLSSLTGLYDLDLEGNEISDISPLTTLTALGSLDLRSNPLNAEAYESHLPAIAANNPGATVWHDPRVTRRVAISSTAGGDVVEPGPGTFQYEEGAVLWLEAQADPCFVFVGWSGTYSGSQNPAFLAMEQDHEIRAHFLSTLDILYVDDDAPNDPGPGDPQMSDPNENGTVAHAFDRIQEAIEVGPEGASIVVRPGTYRENLDLLGKNLTLLGTDPATTPVPYPVIEAAGPDPVVTFSRGEGSDCLLMGFVITRGRGPSAGAVLCDEASPTIAHCLIVGNRVTSPVGAAISCQNSQAVLSNCTIADNYAGPEGAVLMLIDSDVTVLNSILWNDRMANEILATGTSDPNIQYCGVRDSWPDWGNIHTDPLFACPGVWIDPDNPDRISGPADPEAILMGGDYHLTSQAGRWDPDATIWVQDEVTSPCIDAGLPRSPVGPEPAPNGARINMGAYGGTPQASKTLPSP